MEVAGEMCGNGSKRRQSKVVLIVSACVAAAPLEHADNLEGDVADANALTDSGAGREETVRDRRSQNADLRSDAYVGIVEEFSLDNAPVIDVRPVRIHAANHRSPVQASADHLHADSL